MIKVRKWAQKIELNQDFFVHWQMVALVIATPQKRFYGFTLSCLSLCFHHHYHQWQHEQKGG